MLDPTNSGLTGRSRRLSLLPQSAVIDEAQFTSSSTAVQFNRDLSEKMSGPGGNVGTAIRKSMHGSAVAKQISDGSDRKSRASRFTVATQLTEQVNAAQVISEEDAEDIEEMIAPHPGLPMPRPYDLSLEDQNSNWPPYGTVDVFRGKPDVELLKKAFSIALAQCPSMACRLESSTLKKTQVVFPFLKLLQLRPQGFLNQYKATFPKGNVGGLFVQRKLSQELESRFLGTHDGNHKPAEADAGDVYAENKRVTGVLHDCSLSAELYKLTRYTSWSYKKTEAMTSVTVSVGEKISTVSLCVAHVVADAPTTYLFLQSLYKAYQDLLDEKKNGAQAPNMSDYAQYPHLGNEPLEGKGIATWTSAFKSSLSQVQLFLLNFRLGVVVMKLITRGTNKAGRTIMTHVTPEQQKQIKADVGGYSLNDCMVELWAPDQADYLTLVVNKKGREPGMPKACSGNGQEFRTICTGKDRKITHQLCRDFVGPGMNTRNPGKIATKPRMWWNSREYGINNWATGGFDMVGDLSEDCVHVGHTRQLSHASYGFAGVAALFWTNVWIWPAGVAKGDDKKPPLTVELIPLDVGHGEKTMDIIKKYKLPYQVYNGSNELIIDRIETGPMEDDCLWEEGSREKRSAKNLQRQHLCGIFFCWFLCFWFALMRCWRHLACLGFVCCPRRAGSIKQIEASEAERKRKAAEEGAALTTIVPEGTLLNNSGAVEKEAVDSKV